MAASLPASSVTRRLERWPLLDPRDSLRARTSVLLAGVALAVTAASWVIGGAALRKQYAERSGANAEALASQIADASRRELSDRFQDVQLAARLLAEDERGPQAQLVLESLLDRAPQFAWVGAVNTEGVVTSAAQRALVGRNVAQQRWFKVGQLRPYIGTPREDPQLLQALPQTEPGGRVFDVAVPRSSNPEQPSGVVAAHVRWSAIEQLAAFRAGEAARRGDRFAVTLYTATGDIVYDSGTSGWTQPPELPAGMADGPMRGSFSEHTSNGTDYITGFAAMRSLRDLSADDLIVVARQPTASALLPVKTYQNWILALGLFATAIFALLGWAIVRPISRELRRIEAAAHQIRNGDTLALMPAPEGSSEIARACRAIRELIERLRDREA